MERLESAIGDVVLGPVRHLCGKAHTYYLFRQYDASSTIPLEVQVCHALRQQNFISASYPGSEHRVWTDICRILFCQAFIYKEPDNGWRFDYYEIKDESQIDKCWENLKTLKARKFFKHQWQFLEKLWASANNRNVAILRQENLLRRLWLKYIKTVKPIIHVKVADNKSGHECYSYYHELLTLSNLTISKSEAIFDRDDLEKKFNEEGSNRNSKGSCVGADLSYSNDGKSLKHRSVIAGDKKISVEVTKATLKEHIDCELTFLDFPYFSPGEPLTYYLEMLNCLDESSVEGLMADLLTDFAHSPKFYADNRKNVELNPWHWGMPDVVAYDMQSKFHILLECKGPKDRLQKNQIKWFARNSELYNFNVGFVVVSELQIGQI